MLQNRSALVSVTMVAMVITMMLGTGVETSPTGRGSVEPPPLPSLTRTPEKSESSSISLLPEKAESSTRNLSQLLKQWLLTTKPPGVDGTTKTEKNTRKTTVTGVRLDQQFPVNQEAASPDKRAQMLKMILALDELYRTINGTLSTRLTFMPRANGRNSGKKNKVLPAAEGSVKFTTVPPMETGGTSSRASDDVIIPSSLTGRNFKKSLPPQPKKTNKRVCFWKYCSQN